MQRIKQLSHILPQKVATGLGGDMFLVVAVLLIALSAFGLGRISAFRQSDPVTFVYPQTATGTPMMAGGWVVAEQGSGTYFGPWCPQVKAIAEPDKVWFKTTDAAQVAGYLPAKSCKGVQ